MCADRLHLVVLRPGETLLDVSEVRRVRLRLQDGGWLSIYPLHAPMIAETLSGPVYYVLAGKEKSEVVAAGILQISHNTVTILTSGLLQAEAESDIQEETVRFDRLAKALMVALQADPGGVVESGLEES
ncbi:MAG: hypothetical protein JW981_05010 [Anaerolineae bacterium]|nr:hypothetical protein [Anaerolineae bacterium]